MGYKLLGFLVWQRAKWRLRRRCQRLLRKAAMAAVVGLAVAGGAAVARRHGDDDQ
jgi:hypothetical protein